MDFNVILSSNFIFQKVILSSDLTLLIQLTNMTCDYTSKIFKST